MRDYLITAGLFLCAALVIYAAISLDRTDREMTLHTAFTDDNPRYANAVGVTASTTIPEERCILTSDGMVNASCARPERIIVTQRVPLPSTDDRYIAYTGSMRFSTSRMARDAFRENAWAFQSSASDEITYTEFSEPSYVAERGYGDAYDGFYYARFSEVHSLDNGSEALTWYHALMVLRDTELVYLIETAPYSWRSYNLSRVTSLR